MGKGEIKISNKMKKSTKSIWWMPWHQKAMKDVAACEKSRGGGKQPLIREFPNGATLRDVESRNSNASWRAYSAKWNISVAEGK